MDTDVLIVGAGPTGLMLANQLGRRSVRALIIDRHAGPSLQTRALGVQARTLEIYAKLGIVDRALELGKRATGANIWAQGRKMARVPLGDAGRALTPYPYILVLGQDDNERIMGERLRDFGMPVQWNTELVGLEQESAPRDGNAQTAGRQHDGDDGCVGCRMRRRAQRGARTLRHHVPGRPVRARVLRRRHARRRGAWLRTKSTCTCGGKAFTCFSPCAATITGGSSASSLRTCAIKATSRSRACCRRCAAKREAACRSRNARGSRRTALRTEVRRAFAIVAASCWGTPRTSTARWVRKG